MKRAIAAATAAISILGAAAVLAAAVYGKIGEKYAQLGADRGPLGAALTDEAPAAFGGRFNQFQHGFIYWHPETGAHAVWGLIGAKWNELGRERFGYPITDETATPDGRGRYNHFRALQLAPTVRPGIRPVMVKPETSIYWTAQTGAHPVYGAIRDKWSSMGWEGGPLGYPTTDEGSGAFNGRVQGFQGGFLAWHPETSAHEVRGLIAQKWVQVGREQFGYPVTDEMKTADGIGRYSTFRAVQRGDRAEASIYWRQDHGAHAVYGQIRRKWADMGWERGRAGYPTSDEFADGGYRRQNFSGGGNQRTMYLRWSARTGAEFITADLKPRECTKVFRDFQRNIHTGELYLEACQTLMGLDRYCEARGSFVGVKYTSGTSRPYLTCIKRSDRDTAWEQADRIANGVAEGLTDAFVAAAPFMGTVTMAAACVNGVIYACGLLALDLVEKAGAPLDELGGIASDALNYAHLTSQCTGGDVAACVRLGVRGTSAVGITIPGVDPEAAAADLLACTDRNDTAACARLGMAGARAAGATIPGVDPEVVVTAVIACNKGDYAACARLGQAAADAAGVPPGLGPAIMADSQACVDGDAQACTELGRQSASLGLPMGGVVNGSDLALRCNSGDLEACRLLGLAAANAIGMPTLRTWYARPAVRPMPIGVARMTKSRPGVDVEDAHSARQRFRDSGEARALASQVALATVAPSLDGIDLPADIATLPDGAAVNVGARAITAAEARLLLLNADDNAIIIVGGRSMRAGYMKRVLSTAAQSVAPPAR